MQKIWLASAVLIVMSLALVATSCGANSTSQLQTVTVAPAAADAQSYPNGTVPFQAAGLYIDPDRTIMPLTATWTACNAGGPTIDIVISQSGAAQCSSGAHGAYTIYATAIKPNASGSCPNISPCGAIAGGCAVSGSAHLTCP